MPDQDDERSTGRLKQGDIVRVRVLGGEIKTRRVWSTVGDGVQVCSKEQWQRHVDTGDEPLYVGWPPQDVLGLFHA